MIAAADAPSLQAGATKARAKSACTIVGLCTVRTEGDIIAQSLHAWADAIDLVLVVDCGSTDDTVDQVTEICRERSNVCFLGSVGPKHARQIRRHVWAKFHGHFTANTWWLMADADEFVEEELYEKTGVAQAELADHIFSLHANFYYTTLDHQGWVEGRESLADRGRPIEERRRFYRMQTSQRRLFRNLPWLRWNSDESFPTNLSAPSSQRVLFRHYQYRDPLQIEERIKIRSSINPNDPAMKENPHWHRKEVADAISSDNRVLRHSPGEAFIPDPELPPLVTQSRSKSLAKYARAISHAALNPQSAPDFFQGIDAKEIVSRIER